MICGLVRFCHIPRLKSVGRRPVYAHDLSGSVRRRQDVSARIMAGNSAICHFNYLCWLLIDAVDNYRVLTSPSQSARLSLMTAPLRQQLEQVLVLLRQRIHLAVTTYLHWSQLCHCQVHISKYSSNIGTSNTELVRRRQTFHGEDDDWRCLSVSLTL